MSNMFKRSFGASSKDRANKITKQSKRSFRETTKQKRMIEKMDSRVDSPMMERYANFLPSI